MVKIFGGADCRSSRRAFQWLGERGLLCHFVDFKKRGIDEAHLDAWIKDFGWRQLIDKRSVAWRTLTQGHSHQLGPREAREIISRHPALLKSPLIGVRNQWLLGWNAKNKIRLLGLLPEHHRLTLPESTQQVILRDECKTVWLGPRPAVLGQSGFHK
ncbi:MAG: arsenate reductase family protein [Pseudomonadota bacterium]